MGYTHTNIGDNMKVAETASEVTPEYIKQSLEYQYGSRSWGEYSDLLCRTLVHDFQKKSKNLQWLFGDKTRLRISLSASEVMTDLVADNQYAQNIKEIVDAIGATYTAEEFIKGIVNFQKSKVKIGKLLEDISKHIDQVPKHIISKYGTIAYSGADKSAYKEEHYLDTDLPKGASLGSITVCGSSILETKHISQSLNSSFHKSHTQEAITSASSSQDVILSIDINDMVTCSSGSCRSCLRIDGERHLGWMQHFRADFGIIMFSHSSKGEFDKTGRAWIYARMTADGAPYIKPFYKMQKTYGTINSTHRRLVNELIQEMATKNLGLPKPKRHIDNSWPKYTVSPNVAGMGHNGNQPGYFDQVINENAPFYVYPSDIPAFPVSDTNYRYGPTCILPFPDALGLHGYVTDRPNFGDRNTYNSHIGFRPEAILVTCSKLGEQVLSQEAICIAYNTFISHKWLLQQQGLWQDAVATDAPRELEDTNVDDIDIDDF
jgi:hypothetical protein